MGKRYPSFEDRGVYVGFDTPRVALCRARVAKADIDDYEALMPNWTGRTATSGSDLVMAMADIPSWCRLSARDIHVHGMLERERQQTEGHIDPIMMREIRLEADLTHGGEAARAVAERELAIASGDQQNAYLEILAMFGRSYADTAGVDELHQVNRAVLIQLAEAQDDSLQRLVRIVARTVAARVGLSRDLLQKRLDRLSQFAAPVCSLVTRDETRAVGFLSRQQGLLEVLQYEIAEYGEIRPVEVREASEVIDLNIQTFLEYATSRAEAIHAAVLDERHYLDGDAYQRLLDTVARERIRISYALDGWAAHAEHWLAIDRDDRHARDRMIGRILAEMPTPTENVEEAVADRMRSTAHLMSLRARLVKEMHSWADDTLDEALYARVRESREIGANPSAISPQKRRKRPAVAKTAIVKAALGPRSLRVDDDTVDGNQNGEG